MFGEFNPRQAQQIVDQAVHPRALLGHDPQKALLRRGVVGGRPAEGLDKADQGGERRAQLVADVGDEIGAHPLDHSLARAIRQND